MKHNISLLMDGELCDDEAEVLLRKISQYQEGSQEWLTYHLIGDVLRHSEGLSENISAEFFERLHAEPTVLSPRRKTFGRPGIYAMSAVASIMAIAFLGWTSIQINNEPINYQLQPQLRTSMVRPDILPANENINDYLLAHQEYSPSNDVRGAASYIRTVSIKQAVAGK